MQDARQFARFHVPDHGRHAVLELLEVVADGVHRQPQPGRDLLIGRAFEARAQHVGLAWRKAHLHQIGKVRALAQLEGQCQPLRGVKQRQHLRLGRRRRAEQVQRCAAQACARRHHRQMRGAPGAVAPQPRDIRLGVPQLRLYPAFMLLDRAHQRPPILTRPQRQRIALADQRGVKRLQVLRHGAVQLQRRRAQAADGGVRHHPQAVRQRGDLRKAHGQCLPQPGVRGGAKRRE